MTIRKLENGKTVKVILNTNFKFTPRNANTEPYANSAQTTSVTLRV
jgi:hypothetical protein